MTKRTENELFEQWKLKQKIKAIQLFEAWKARAELADIEKAILQAEINELREALEDISKLPYTSYKWGTIAAQALAKTPPQCLQEHDNEVIELALNKVSQIKAPHNYTAAESHIYEQAHTDCWKAIRALKEKQNEQA